MSTKNGGGAKSSSSPTEKSDKGVRMLSCLLKSTNEDIFPSIELEDKVTLVIGRQAEVQVKDPRISRRQIEATCNVKQQQVLIQQIGPNDSALNGKPIRMGLTVTATDGDTLDLCLPGKARPFANSYSYWIKFDCASPTPSTSASSTASKRSNEDAAAAIGPPPKIPKMFLPKGSPNADQFRKDSLLSTKGRWEAIKGDDFFVFSNDESEYKQYVGAFDLDGTLIKTKSGRVFPKDEHDWAFRTSTTLSKLQTFFSDHQDFKFLIFTNQNGIKSSADVAAFKRKMELIIRQVGVPATAFVATKKDQYRKPMTGSWDVFVSRYNQGKCPDLSESFYCGDAAGRPKDHSKADLFFALNLELKFKTPEEFFEGSKPATFAPPVFCSKDVIDASRTNGVANSHIKFPHTQEIIIMVGMPASGKSSFVKSVLLPKGYTHVNRDTLKTIPKCIQVAESALREGKSVVIDNTNPTKKDRDVFSKLVTQRKNVTLRCFRMMVDHPQCLHNNKFRLFIGDLPSAIPDVAFNSFKSNFEEPMLSEGFAEIVPVYFVPQFETSEREQLYRKYLLEK